MEGAGAVGGGECCGSHGCAGGGEGIGVGGEGKEGLRRCGW